MGEGEVKEVKKIILLIIVALMALAILVTPVFAIGPWQAAEVNDNENFFVLFGGVGNRRGEASGTNVWAATEDFSVEWKWRDPTDAKGLMNSALVPTTITELVQYASEDYDNKWVFLSGKPASGHGMLYYLWYGFSKSASFAAYVENTNPNGELWMHNSIYNNMP